MGVGWLELRLTPDFVVGMDLDFISLETEYSKPELPTNNE